MNVLLIGSGGREHALAYALCKSNHLTTLFATPGNPGIGAIAQNVALDINDHNAVVQFCRQHQIEFVVVGPEAPLVDGIADRLTATDILTFGPSANASRLESSKGFTKDMCTQAGIPTAKYQRFTEIDAAKNYVKQEGAPIVIKADGLAAGKGVVVAQTETEAFIAIEDCLTGKFGQSNSEIVIEECLVGPEASLFVLSDGEHILPLLTAQDYKRAYDNDEGPNTGGMGAISPAPTMNQALEKEAIDKIIQPTIDFMKANGNPFKGVLYAGLMLTESGPKLIEYNVRFGDPECQVIMMLLQSDLLEILKSAADGSLNQIKLDWYDGVAMTVVLAARGYPGEYKKLTSIKGLTIANSNPNLEIFHAGTSVQNGEVLANGGRVLNITARGQSFAQVRELIYNTIDSIEWNDKFYRTDIGKETPSTN